MTESSPADLALIKATLRAVRQENYRRTRWEAIQAGRDAGMTWQAIADELNVQRPSVMRTWQLGPTATQSN